MLVEFYSLSINKARCTLKRGVSELILSKSKIVPLLFLVVLLAFIIGCNICRFHPGFDEHTRIIGSRVYNDNQIADEFNKLTISQQIDVYLYAERCVGDTKTPVLILENADTKKGEIVNRIEQSSDAYDRMKLISLLRSIDLRCNCVSNDDELVMRLKTIQTQLSDSQDDIEYNVMSKRLLNSLTNSRVK